METGRGAAAATTWTFSGDEHRTARYLVDGDGTATPFYASRVRLTWYLYVAATQPILETLTPIIFSLFTSSANYIYAGSIDDFLANQIALGLTVVLMIPLLSKSESFSDKFEMTHLYVLFIFVGFLVSARRRGPHRPTAQLGRGAGTAAGGCIRAAGTVAFLWRSKHPRQLSKSGWRLVEALVPRAEP